MENRLFLNVSINRNAIIPCLPCFPTEIELFQYCISVVRGFGGFIKHYEMISSKVKKN